MIPDGTYIIENKQTGQHRTFLIYTWKDGTQRSIRLLSETDGRTARGDFGFVIGGEIQVWARKRRMISNGPYLSGIPFGRMGLFEMYAWMLMSLFHKGSRSQFASRYQLKTTVKNMNRQY